MPVIMNSVESSNIAKIGFEVLVIRDFDMPNPKKFGNLYVEFKNGKTYRYHHVNKDIFETLLTHESPGAFLAQNVKGNHPTEEFPTEEKDNDA